MKRLAFLTLAACTTNNYYVDDVNKDAYIDGKAFEPASDSGSTTPADGSTNGATDSSTDASDSGQQGLCTGLPDASCNDDLLHACNSGLACNILGVYHVSIAPKPKQTNCTALPLNATWKIDARQIVEITTHSTTYPIHPQPLTVDGALTQDAALKLLPTSEGFEGDGRLYAVTQFKGLINGAVANCSFEYFSIVGVRDGT